MESINLHKKLEFVIYTPGEGPGIKCEFQAELLDEVKNSLGCSVTVHGRLIRRQGRLYPDKVLVEKLKRRSAEEKLPELADLIGISSSASTDGLDAVKFLRKVRYGD
ncbi:MAG TPA: hypothetical protein PKA06_09805 [Gemmatales bacterium]|nr:hypothetical protein [Gemmatales bacterium]HMP17434.1 hypothetical protein [Gemmatales bacterium]